MKLVRTKFFKIKILQLKFNIFTNNFSLNLKLISLSGCFDKAGSVKCQFFATEERCGTGVGRSKVTRNMCRKSCGLCCKYNKQNQYSSLAILNLSCTWYRYIWL